MTGARRRIRLLIRKEFLQLRRDPLLLRLLFIMPVMQLVMFGYVVAAACDEIWVQPSGDVVLPGVVAGGLFLRDALDKLSALPQFAHRREYKSAAETYQRSSMSEANREMLERLVAFAGPVPSPCRSSTTSSPSRRSARCAAVRSRCARSALTPSSRSAAGLPWTPPR